MRAYEFIIEGRPLTPQEKKDFQSQADYGGEDPDAPADKYGVQSNQTKQALGRGTTSIGGVDIPDDAWSAGIGSSAAMGSLAGIKSASAPSAKQTTAPSTKAPTASTTTSNTPVSTTAPSTKAPAANTTTSNTPASTTAPPIENLVVPVWLNRPKPEDVTHAYRNMNPAELQHAQQTGYFTAKDPTHDNRKWWTANTADPQGMGGLNTEPYPKSIVRVPIDKVPSNTAVHIGHAEHWDRKTGAWVPALP